MPANPYQFLRPVPPADFVGRWPLVREIATNLTLEGAESHAVVAGRRCGKAATSLGPIAPAETADPATGCLCPSPSTSRAAR
jgi:hypothetical protein